MYKKLSSFIFLTFLFTGCANGDGLSMYGKDGYDFTFFSVNDKDDLIDVSNVLCQYSHGASKDCDTYLSPTYDFPKDSYFIKHPQLNLVLNELKKIVDHFLNFLQKQNF